MITKKQAQKWANALRSSKYSQGKGALQNADGYCCLGVACSVFIPKNKLLMRGVFIAGGYPTIQPNAPKWLKSINKDLGDRLGNGFSFLNDVFNFSFDEIADIIELVYVHKAL